MDGGFRAPRQADRRVVSRPEPTYRPPEEPQPIPTPAPEAPPKPAHRASTHHTAKAEKPSKRFRWPLIVAIIVVVLVAGWLVWSNARNGAAGIDSSKYQAVFFTNGQVYFGKLKPVNQNYMKLTDVYYLQTKDSETSDSENPQESADSESSSVQLIKLGSEIHGPEDAMIISKDQVLFYENLKPDGKVSQTIKQSQNTNKF